MESQMPASSFYIQNPWTGLVIDIGENSKTPSRGTLLRANAKMTSAPGNWYQLWTFSPPVVETSGTYYWLQTANGDFATSPLVIDVAESGNVIQVPGKPGTLKEGSPLDAWTMKSLQGDDVDAGLSGASNQLWSFGQDAASGYYFIENWLTRFVIDIAEGGSGQQPKAGAYLDAFANKKNQNKPYQNQLWQFVDVNGATVTPPSGTPPDTGTVRGSPGSVKQ
jgi:hypothetical protein